MEPNKLENQMQEKLNAREIKPSAQSWDRLDAMLSVEENKKPKRNFKWLFVAASMIGFVFAGLLFFQQENPTPKTNNHQTVVESNVNTEKEKTTQKSSNQNNEPVEIQSGINETAVASVIKEVKKEKKQADTVIKEQQYSKEEIENKEAVAEIHPQKTDENPKETELLASTDPVKPEGQKQNKPKIEIDANALLSQVDGEIELTFRQKAIKRISKKLQNAKEVVASRNQE
ncbi:hypothetical protein [Flavobacterium sp.]|uniref:hypothetical protein n=1 Tax=Flavobacterium sp. TaxID=239 RepID=UPI003D6B58C7